MPELTTKRTKLKLGLDNSNLMNNDLERRISEQEIIFNKKVASLKQLDKKVNSK